MMMSDTLQARAEAVAVRKRGTVIANDGRTAIVRHGRPVHHLLHLAITLLVPIYGWAVHWWLVWLPLAIFRGVKHERVT